MSKDKPIRQAQGKLNTRQHLVLINALKGKNQTDAYEAVYGPNPNSYTLASELFRKPHFKAELDRRLNGILSEVETAMLSKEEKRFILANIARAQLADLIDDKGELVLNKKSPAMKALKEWNHRERTDRDGNPIVTRSIKLIDPLTAIMEDNKMMGHYAPSKHLVGKIQYNISFVDKVKDNATE